VRDPRARRFEADLAHGVAEAFAVLGHVDGFARGGDQFDAIFFQHALAHEVKRAVQRRLPTHRRQQRIRPLFRDDAFHRAPVDRLDVNRVGRLGIRHDRRRIRVHQDDAVALLLERLAGLRAGVVELARLTDDDRTGADDQDTLDVGSLRHQPSATFLPASRAALCALRRS
jgi:hypothetical protein